MKVHENELLLITDLVPSTEIRYFSTLANRYQNDSEVGKTLPGF